MIRSQSLLRTTRFTGIGLLIFIGYVVAVWLLEMQGGAGVSGALLRLLLMPGYAISLVISPVVDPVLNWLDPAPDWSWWAALPVRLLPFVLLDVMRALLRWHVDSAWDAALAAATKRHSGLPMR